MKIALKHITALLTPLVLIGCASTPIQEINAGKATLLTETISVTNYFKADFIIEFKDYGRRKADIMISDCEKGNGTIRVEATNGSYINNLLRNGTTLADKMFAEACQRILPLSAQYERDRARINASKTPEERQRERENMLMLLQLQQMNNARDAADTRNKQLIDAIKDIGNKPSTTDCTRDGYGNVRCTTR